MADQIYEWEDLEDLTPLEFASKPYPERLEILWRLRDYTIVGCAGYNTIELIELAEDILPMCACLIAFAPYCTKPSKALESDIARLRRAVDELNQWLGCQSSPTCSVSGDAEYLIILGSISQLQGHFWRLFDHTTPLRGADSASNHVATMYFEHGLN